MACKKCWAHRQVIKTAVQQGDARKATTEVVKAAVTVFGKIGSNSVKITRKKL